MSVTSFRQKIQRTFKNSGKPELKATRVYIAHTSSKNDPPELVAAYSACPKIGDSYDTETTQGSGMTCQEVSVECESITAAGGAVYTVTAEYSTRSESDKNGEKEPAPINPLDREAVVRLTFETSETTFWVSKEDRPEIKDSAGAAIDNSSSWTYGKAIVNSAGRPFADGLKDTVWDPVYTLEKNVSTQDWVQISERLESLIGAVNSVVFMIIYRGANKVFAKRTVRLIGAESEPGFENGIAFEKVRIALKVRKDGWKIPVLDQGTDAWQDSDHPTNVPAPCILDANGDPIRVPALLDGQGLRLTTGTPRFIYFRLHDLGLLQNLPIEELQ